jgi:hypothetical protein
MHFCSATSLLTSTPATARRVVASAGLTLATLILAMSSFAVSADPTPPPSRVGRIGFIDGDVSFFADREQGWRKARMNFPVTSKNSVWTNGTSRAEVRLGASAVRLDADTMLDFIAIDDVHTSLYLQRGNINIRVRAYAHRPGTDETYRDQFRIETDSGTWTLEQSGRYRLESIQGRNETRISVYAGQASFDNGSARVKVETGKSLRLSTSGGATTFSFDPASEFAFDRWAESRDLRWDEAHQRYASERIVSPYMTGYEELDSHGDWIDEPEYGRLWTPRVVAAGWVPYRYGSWSYVRPWGWTWIDEAPWGFAPFHYGRWVQIRTRWYWAPGRYHHRPVYAPALVGWYGSGNTHISIAVGKPIGWFPLAPREHFIPAYTTSTTYIRNINYITNNTIVTGSTQYQNQGAGGTMVNQNVVVRGEPVWRSATINSGSTGRMVKPAPDPMDPARGNSPTWVLISPPSAPTQPPTSALPPPTAVLGEAPSVRRPTWVYGETPRSQVGAQTMQQPVQPASIPVPGTPVVPMLPAKPGSLDITPPPSNAGEPVMPVARPKPNPRAASSSTSTLPLSSAPIADAAQSASSSSGYSITTSPSQGTERSPLTDSPPMPREMQRRERIARTDGVERSEREIRGESRGVEPRTPRTEGTVVNAPREETNRNAPVQIQSPVATIGKPREPREDKPSARNLTGDGRASHTDTRAAQPRTDERAPRVSQQ